MFVGIQMVLAIFIITEAFGAETEFQRGIILFRSAADGAFMLGNSCRRLGLFFKFMSPFHLFWGHMDMVPACQEKYHKVKQ